MAVIDDKVVAMSFESSKFESGVNSTVSALEKLKAALKLPAASKGLEDVSAAAKRIDLSHIGKGVDAIVQKLNYFSVAALAIFANVAMKAVQTGAQLTKALTIDPILTGYREYAMQLQYVQTIMANTQAAGAKLKNVNAALRQLNEYSDKTIYNFGEMARNIGTFTAAGVDLKTSVGAIKGIANLAALSGSSSQQASTAMYQLSQAIAAGRVSLMDWNSVVNAGMGGAVFQRALAQTAEAMGELKKGSVELVGPMKNVSIAGKSFRESLAGQGPKWLTSDVLTTTLKQFTGDLSDAELAAIGFNEQQIKAIQLTGKTAMFAATEVKTLTQVLDVAKETAGSGWAQTWQIIFGDFGEAKKTFTALSNAVNGFINANAEARNKVLKDWKDLGGRTVLINAIKTAFQNLGEILAPIKDAFRDIFPAKTGRDLFNATVAFQNFAKSLKPSAETVENLRRTFRGVFAALDIGKQIISGIFTVFKELFSAVGGGNGGFLELTGSIGDWVVSIDEALKKGDRLQNFFKSLGEALAKPVEMLSKFARAVGEALRSISMGGISTGLNGMTEAATPLQKVLEALSNAWDKFSNSVKNSVDMEAVLESIGTAISGIGVAIGNAVSTMNFQVILDAIRTGLFGALVVMFKQFLGKGSFLNQISQGFSKGILANVSGMFEGLSGSMKAMQQQIKAKTLKEIAIAVALLAASVLMLSLVDPKRLNASLGAMTIMFGELIGAMALLDKIAQTGGFIKLPIIIAGLIGLAAAIDLLTVAVVAMSFLSWDELIKGLTGVGALLIGVSAAAKPLSANSAGLIKASAGIFVLAAALNVMALAVRQFGSLSWEELVKGLIGVGVGLKAIVLTMNSLPVGENAVAFKSALAIIALAVALKILASAITDLAGLSWEQMARGLTGVGAALAGIVLAMKYMPKPKYLAGIGTELLLVAAALWVISDAIVKMGALSTSEMARGLASLGGAMLILVKGLNAMSGSLKGAAALALVAVGLALLAPAIVMLGKQSWTNIAKGLISLAGALIIIGVAGNLLAGASVAFLAFGAAVLMIGGGVALIGAGLFLFAAGLSAVAVAGPAAIGVLIAAINEFLLAVPKLAESLALALLSIVEAFAKTAPQFVDAMVKIINSLLDVIIQSSPKVVEAITALITVMLQVLAQNQDRIIAAGLALLIALLQGIRDNIAQVTTMVVDIIVTFLGTLAANITRIVAAGANLLVQFLKGIANNIAKVVLAVGEIVTKFIGALATNYVKIITAGANLVVKLVEGVTKNMSKIVKAGADAIISFVTGLGQNAARVVSAGVKAVLTFIEGLGKNAVVLAEGAAKVIVQFLNGLTKAINTYAPQIQEASKALGWAIINGMTWGLAGKAQEVYDKATEIANKVLGIFKKVPLINSPSKATMEVGASLMEGLTKGMDGTANDAYSSAESISRSLINVFTTVFQTNSPSKVMMEIGKFVGQGFVQGLKGTQGDINGAFKELNEMLTKTMVTARETIASEQEKLDKLREAKKPDAEAIAKSQKIIDENEKLLKRSTETRKALITTLKGEKNELIALSNEYDKVSARIQAAQDKLQGLIADKKAFKDSLTDQYSDLPDIPTTDAEGNKLTPEEQVNAYLEALATQSKAVATYKTTLEELRKLGLDDATYEKLLADGTADQEFANALLAGGKTAVEGLNKLDSQLMKVSKSLATQAAGNLKDAGIQAAKGLLAGLTSQNAKIRKAMLDLIDDIEKEIRKRLGIKSPSKVFEEIGTYAMMGLVQGFNKYKRHVNNAITTITDEALSTMADTMSRLQDTLHTHLDSAPKITPIVDLSDVYNKSAALYSAFDDLKPITALASYAEASRISADQFAALEEAMNPERVGHTLKFEQYNYSPKALSEIDIYRQTRNQLSQINSALAEA